MCPAFYALSFKKGATSPHMYSSRMFLLFSIFNGLRSNGKLSFFLKWMTIIIIITKFFENVPEIADLKSIETISIFVKRMKKAQILYCNSNDVHNFNAIYEFRIRCWCLTIFYWTLGRSADKNSKKKNLSERIFGGKFCFYYTIVFIIWNQVCCGRTIVAVE